MSNTTPTHSGPQSLSVLVDHITRPIFSRYRGYLEAQLITDWNFIAGYKLGQHTVPRKVVFADKEQKTNGVLHLDVLNSAVALELPYMIPVLLEKIAVYMGYKAITSIKTQLRPRSLQSTAPHYAPPPLSTEKAAQLKETVSLIDDEALREALYRLGLHVLADNQKDKRES